MNTLLPNNYELPPATIQICTVDLSRPQSEAISKQTDAILSADEQVRAASMPDARAQEFRRMRVALRIVLSSLLSVEPNKIEIVLGEQGKPLVPETDIHFNLAHAKGCGVIALSRGQPVGVDLENLAHQRPFLKLAKRYFSPEECHKLENSDSDFLTEKFYRLWCGREALSKCIGGSVYAQLDAQLNLQEYVKILDLVLHYFQPVSGQIGAFSYPTEAVLREYSQVNLQGF